MQDIFIAKYDSSGNLLWAKKAGGTNDDIGYKLSVDGGGNVCLTGYIESYRPIFDTDTLQKCK
jgi:hypothetical protein